MLDFFVKKLFQKCAFAYSLFVLFFSGAAVGQPTDQAQELYEQGVTLRKAKEFEKALTCFEPLAQAGDEKAQHNLAFCYHELGEVSQAYHWYKKASQKGFDPSIRNLKKLNYFLLLPDEMLTHIASFLSMKEFSRFSLCNKRHHDVFNKDIHRVNLLSPTTRYAHEWHQKLRKISFEPLPKAIYFRNLVEIPSHNRPSDFGFQMNLIRPLTPFSEQESVRVHFRHLEHLKHILKTTVIPETKNLIFTHDDDVQDGEEVRFFSQKFTAERALLVYSDVPVCIKKQIPWPLKVILPPQSQHENALSDTAKVYVLPNTHQTGDSLLNLLETFDDSLYHTRTKDASKLLRIGEDPYLPELKDLFPNGIIAPIATDLHITKDDSLYTLGAPLVYIAPSFEELVSLRRNYPTHSDSIYYVDPLKKAGFYSEDPLQVQKGILLQTDNDLYMAGTFHNSNYRLRALVKGMVYGFELKMSGLSLSCNGIIGGVPFEWIPPTVSPEEWKDVLVRQRELFPTFIPAPPMPVFSKSPAEFFDEEIKFHEKPADTRSAQEQLIEFKEITYIGSEYFASFEPHFVQLPPEERQKILLATHKKIRDLKEDVYYQDYMKKKEGLEEHTGTNWPSNIRNLFENVLSVYTQPSISYGAITFDGIAEKLAHYLMSERTQRVEEFKTLLWPKAQNEQDEGKLICHFFCRCPYGWAEDILKVKAALHDNPSLTFEDLNKILYFVDSF